jgi:tRNA uridine 5-carboxymethylaminomethyl modification enzyme
MSCNPAIGGLAKGQLVKEVDALGGQMGKAIDATGIQFRQLNTKKGPAVRSSRAQADRQAYRLYMKAVIESQENLRVKQGLVEKILTEGSSVQGIEMLFGEKFRCSALILTPGTFLHGLMHIGLDHFPGGRMGERASDTLADSLKSLGFTIGRFKTGTCPRIDGKTIDFKKLDPQAGDEEIAFFSYSSPKAYRRQLPCYITYTNEETHRIIRSGLDRSPLFTGVIKGTGVRYCPSIEDKIHRFPQRDRHHIFLEPEGLNTMEYYPNGLATSLPLDIQTKMVRSIRGLEHAEFIRPGYGIEHDIVDPTQLFPTLETKQISGLYLAGQINGTTGYEEAASQGLVAGINAVLKLRNRRPLIMDRSQSYIGVLIDDLVTKGTNEPYRMFTSRVEYRLLLREDNAHFRLTPIGHEIGLVDHETLQRTLREQESVDREVESLRAAKILPKEEINNALASRGLPIISKPISLLEFLRRPHVQYSDLTTLTGRETELADNLVKLVEVVVKYEGFVKRQQCEIDKLSKIEKIKLPEHMDYAPVHGLSSEIKEKLSKIRPLNLGQASRISGVTPAAISILMIHLEKIRRSNTAV